VWEGYLIPFILFLFYLFSFDVSIVPVGFCLGRIIMRVDFLFYRYFLFLFIFFLFLLFFVYGMCG
jgi:hypothetical protein